MLATDRRGVPVFEPPHGVGVQWHDLFAGGFLFDVHGGLDEHHAAGLAEEAVARGVDGEPPEVVREGGVDVEPVLAGFGTVFRGYASWRE